MSTFISIVIIFGALVFFHELGHLLLAKRAGILCREFAIGFGPKIFSSKKGETLYTIRLLPLGGFVRMAGEDPEGIEIKPGKQVGLIFDQEGKVKQIIANQLSRYPDAKVVTVEKADIEHDLVLRGHVNDELTESYPVHPEAEFIQDGLPVQIAPYNRQFGSKSLIDRFLAIFAGPLMNFLLAFVLLAVYAMTQGIPVDEAQLGKLDKDGAAYEAGLHEGDRVLSVDGEAVNTWEELVKVIQQNPNEEMQFTIQRDGQTEKVTVTPDERETQDGESSEGYIGVYMPTETSFLGSLQYGVQKTGELTVLIIQALGQLVTGQISFDNLSGPVGIYNYTDQAAEGGVFVLLQWAAFLSVNLGIFNLLPLPALDGGRLTFLAIEAVRGKPLDPQKEGLVHFIGFALLMLLMIVVTWNDIHKFFIN
ncbi:RIP metalloprotease RseP [Pseudalkalibacillus salsuginis]|uniref:RIP metalloprotease RseP n=1 Tax=Pseudalkalibacillus salsuginis TaxID=2910972 RepID=UPI001F431A99|nr:RIP metalloprotease RseP [Pseudalkalibacillus salsuginis]MCF6410603.1 RIP metalloprotease RseP [Pseudalkalibacillus salsuginis]